MPALDEAPWQTRQLDFWLARWAGEVWRYSMIVWANWATRMSGRMRHSLIAGIGAALLAGCQAIPDVSAWNQATRDVTGAVTTGFQSAADVNGDIARRLIARPEFADPARRYESVAQTIGSRAADYEKLFGAISDYSGSLAAIARASDNSQKTVDAVAGSVNQLVEAIGGTLFVGASFDLGKLLVSEAIKIKAAHDFGDAVQKADPVIAQVSDLLIRDLADLQRTVGPSKDEAIRAAIEEPNKKRLEYRAALERRRSDLQTIIKNAITPNAAAPGLAISTTSLLDVNDAPELVKVEQYIREADAWYQPIQTELKHALQVRAKSEELAIQAGHAVQAWKASHASLAAAVKERRVPQSGQLAALALRIQKLANDIKKEN
jgi:hypothetical protein